jgi:hypothetical protein
MHIYICIYIHKYIGDNKFPEINKFLSENSEEQFEGDIYILLSIVCMYIEYIFIYMYVCMYVEYIYVYIHIYIYTYTYRKRWRCQ